MNLYLSTIRLLAAFPLLVSIGNTFGQFGLSIGRGNSGELVSSGKSIPDPKSVLMSSWLLRNEWAARDMRFDEEQQKDIKAFISETKGVPGVVIIEALPGMREEEVALRSDAILANREAKIRELLDPIQLNRLKEIVYRVEISRVGYKTALLDGFLGQDAGVDETDRSTLEVTFAILEERFAREELVLLEKLRDETLKLLSDDQRQKLVGILGKPYKFGVSSRAGQKPNVPNPESSFEAAIHLEHDAVAVELNIAANRLASILKKRKQGIKSTLAESNRQISELLLPIEATRLKQLSFRFELEIRGLCRALSRGFLGNAVELNETQRNEIYELENKTLKKMDDDKRNAFLSQLSRKQQECVVRLLGKFVTLQD